MDAYSQLRTVRQDLAALFGDGVTGITTSLGSTTALNDTARGERNEYWIGADVAALDLLNAGLHRRITDSAAGVGLTTAAMPNAWANATSYELYFNFAYNQYNTAIQYAVRQAIGLHWLDWFWDDLTIVADTYDYAFPARHDIATVTADAGSTASILRDSVLTQADDYWNGARVVCLTATNTDNIGIVRECSNFVAATDDMEFDIAWPAAISAADTFHVTRMEPHYITFVEYIPSGGTIPVGLRYRDWEIVHRNGPRIRFMPGAVPPLDSAVRVYGVRHPELPTVDRDPVEVPYSFAINMAYFQLLRSKPRRPDFKLDADQQNKQEAYDSAMVSLNKERFRRPDDAKKVQ